MKQKFIALLAFFAVISLGVNAQVGNLTPEQIQADKDTKLEEIKTLQEDIDKLDAALATMDFSGWKFGGNGGINFSGAGAQNWLVAGDPIENGLNTNIAFNVFANMSEDKFYWFNGANLQLGYLTQWAELTDDFKISDATKQTLDKMYISSLPGYRINSELAATGLLDVQTSLGGFANPAIFSGGLGVTWTPVQTMDGKLIPLKVVFHPLTWRGTYVSQNTYERNAEGNIADSDTTIYNLRNELGLLENGDKLSSDFGLKVVADYGRTLKILGNSIGWTTQLRAFMPYTKTAALDLTNPGGFLPGVNNPEINWDNAFSINLFRNLAVSANWNLRSYRPETEKIQHLWNFGFGLSTTF